MPKFKFAKLVRDKIVDRQITSGAKVQYRTLDDEGHKTELVKKIIEEAQEILRARADEVASEISDVQQALDDLKEKYDLSSVDVAKAQMAKNDKNGAFKQGLFIDSVELPESDRWVEYYRKNPERYPEIK